MSEPRIERPSEVERLLREGGAVGLIGVAESYEVEFKAEPYPVVSDRQKHQLAKDVAALANADGGIIVLGIKTSKSDLQALDVAAEARPFPASMFSREIWLSLLADWIYPAMEGLEIVWYEDAQKEAYGYAAIRVPQQAMSVRPFLVTKEIHEDGKVDGLSFGYFQRRRAEARALGVHEIQSLMRDGNLFREAIDRRLGEELDSDRSGLGSAPAQPGQDVAARTNHRVEALVSALNLSNRPTFILTASADPPIVLTEIFQSAEHPIVQLLREPPELRASGFDLQVSRNVEIVSGQVRRSVLEEWKALELSRDGVLVFVADGGGGFLSWATPEDAKALRINQIALAESVLLFCRLARDVFAAANTQPRFIRFGLQLKRMCFEKEPPFLFAGPLSRHFAAAPWERKQGTECDLSYDIAVESGFDADEVAYQLVSEVYVWVGHEHEAIPYVDRDGPRPRISAGQLAV